MAMPDTFDTVILSACRTPIGSFGGAFKDLSASDLGAIAIREAIGRAGVAAADLGDVVMGCVLQGGADCVALKRLARRAGLLRGREPASSRTRAERRQLRARDRAGGNSSKTGRAGSRRKGRISAPGDDSRQARLAEARVQKGWIG